MQDSQRIIVEWMRDVIKRRDISARAWAERASLGKDTVSRAMREDYAHVTSTSTLVKLAESIGERAPGAAAAIPSVESLTEVLSVLVTALASEPRLPPDLIESLAGALRDTLLHLADDPEAALDPRLSNRLARAAASQLVKQREL